jgi:Ran GTPase-activating protein (RanGAP) involved in mRNA processing and transport
MAKAKRRTRGAAQAPQEEAVALCASAHAHEVLQLVLPLLPVAHRLRATAVCRVWRDAGAAASVWADLDFCGGGAAVDTPALLALCRRAGTALRSLHLDADAAARTLSAASVMYALRAGGAEACCGLQRLSLPAPDHEHFGYDAGVIDPLLLLPAQAEALAAACPALRHAACGVVCASDAEAARAANALPGPLTLCFVRSWRDAPDDADEGDEDEDATPAPAHWRAPSVAGMLLLGGRGGVEVAGRPTEEAVLRLAAALQEAPGGALRQLDVLSPHLGDAGAQALAAALRADGCSLRSLHVQAPRLRDAGGAALARALHDNTSLRSLRLRGAAPHLARATGAAVAAALRANNTLLSLDLEGAFGDATMVALGDALRDNGALTALSLENTDDGLGVEGAQALAAALLPGSRSRLATLRVSVGRHARSAALAALCTAAAAPGGALALTSLRVERVGGGAGVQLTETHWLDSLCAMLRANSTLRTLLVPGLFKTDGSLTALAGALRDNRTLRALDISHAGCAGCVDSGGAALAAALRDDGSGAAASLTSLDMSGLRVGKAGSLALCGMLRDNTALRVLRLPRALLGEVHKKGAFATVQPLCAALRVNATLRELAFSCDSGMRDTIALGRALEHNVALTVLDVDIATLGSGGAAALATGLRAHARLRSLCLGMYRLHGSDLRVLAGALSGTRTLTRIGLNIFHLVPAATALGSAVRANACASLVTLELHTTREDLREDCAASMAGRQPFDAVLL